MIKMLVLDIDGTMLNRDYKYTPELKDCLRRLRKSGVKVVIATGRMYHSTLEVARELEFNTPIICFQGGEIRNFYENDKTLYKATIPYEKAFEVVDYFRAEKVHTNLYHQDRLYVEQDDDYIKDYVRNRSVTYNVLNSFEDLKFDVADKLLAIENDREKFAKIYKELGKKYEGELHVIRSMHNFLEVCNINATKGNAIRFLCKYWDIKIEETMAIGDQDNDIEMISAAGIGVAMGNGTEGLKAAADFITKSVTQDGVCYAVKEFIGV